MEPLFIYVYALSLIFQSGQYGRGCRFQCQRCGAHALPGCDIVTGNCLCSVGYTGPMCDRPCPEGTYGKNCSLLCRQVFLILICITLEVQNSFLFFQKMNMMLTKFMV